MSKPRSTKPQPRTDLGHQHRILSMYANNVVEPKQKTDAQLAKQMERRQRARQARKERELNNESAAFISTEHDLKDEDSDNKHKKAIGANFQAKNTHGTQPKTSAVCSSSLYKITHDNWTNKNRII